MPRPKKDPNQLKEVKEASKPVNKVDRKADTKTYPKVKTVQVKPKTMTRSELTQSVAQAVGQYMEITQGDAESIVSGIITSMIEGLKSGDEIEIRGFGSFRLRTRRARRGRNPKTGQGVDVAAKQVVYFKMGRELKDFLKQTL